METLISAIGLTVPSILVLGGIVFILSGYIRWKPKKELSSSPKKPDKRLITWGLSFLLLGILVYVAVWVGVLFLTNSFSLCPNKTPSPSNTLSSTTKPPTITYTPTIEKTIAPTPTPQSLTFLPEDRGGQLTISGCNSWRLCQISTYAIGRNDTSYWGSVAADYIQGYYEIDRIFLYFDTSRLPQNAQITRATLKLCSVGRLPDGNSTIYIVQSEASPQYYNNDFNKYSITTNDVSVTFDNIYQCKSISLNPTALKWIIPNGITKFALLHYYDYNNEVPYSINAVYLGLYGDPNYHAVLDINFYSP